MSTEEADQVSSVTLVLESDTQRRESTGQEVPLHPNLCGPCADCAEFFSSLSKSSTDENAFWAATLGHPSIESVKGHAASFGLDGVEPWMVVSRTRSTEKKQSLAEMVTALLQRKPDASAAVVAEVLGITEKKARAAMKRVKDAQQ